MLALLLSAFALIAPADLDKRFADFSSNDPKVRLAAAQWIVAQSADTDVLIQRLGRPRATSPELFRRLFLEMWGQVPNWKSGDPMWVRKPEPPWTPPPRVKGQPRPQRPKPHDPETLDWLTALNELDLASPALSSTESMDAWTRPEDWKPPKTKPVVKPIDPAAPVEPPPPPPVPPTPEQLVTARAEAMETVALLRGIAASKRMDAPASIFKLAFEYNGVFRDECGRQVRSMESYSVPALIKLMHTKVPKQRRYASYQLDRMDRARPSKAIAAAPDDRVKAAIIHAYGEEKALEAVEAVLNQVDAPSHRVRKEARWAWLRYVTGKPPPPAPKRKRKLPGGREEEEEKPDYLTYREIALLALQKQVQEIENEPPSPKLGAKELTDRLFDYYDKKHAAEWDAEFAAAQAKEAAGDWKAATDGYGWILAHDPNYARRAEMAKAYARQADELRKNKQIPQALGYYRQAVDLDPNGAEAKYASARVALLDGQESLAHGQADVGSFRRAVSLDPSLAEAKDGLAQAEAMQGRRRWLEGAEGVGAVFALLLGLWFLWKRVQPYPLTGPPAPPSSGGGSATT